PGGEGDGGRFVLREPESPRCVPEPGVLPDTGRSAAPRAAAGPPDLGRPGRGARRGDLPAGVAGDPRRVPRSPRGLRVAAPSRSAAANPELRGRASRGVRCRGRPGPWRPLLARHRSVPLLAPVDLARHVIDDRRAASSWI